MKVFVVVDMEGATGVVHRDQLMPDGRGYSSAQALLTDDVNAVIEGVLAVDAPATIVVGDGHGTMRNVLLERIHPCASVVVGGGHPSNKPLLQCEGIDASFDAAFLLGFHTMAGTPGGLLAHTFVGSTIARMMINGRAAGEAEVDALILGSFGVPVLGVVGNSDLEPEIRTWNPTCGFVATKQVLGPTAAICKPPARTQAEITDMVSAMVRRHYADPVPPYSLGSTVELSAELYRTEMVDRISFHGDVKRLGDRTIATEGPMDLAFRHLWKAIAQALTEPPAWLM
ncbi:MAG: M55 family metallopeptidase [Candidatus Kapaibacteriota bacterium]